MDVQELCRKLKPVIGDRADRFWLAYLSEDSKGRLELESVLQLLYAKYIGGAVDELVVPLSAPSRELARGEYSIGLVSYNNNVLYPFGLQENEWIQHAAIFGRSGAGKTNAVFTIIMSFLQHKKPFLIFDWKRNYRDLLSVRSEEILVYTVGRQTVPFVFNPLIPPAGIDPSTWLKKLIEIIAHSYYLGEGVMYLLQEAMHAVYQEYGVYNRTPQSHPTFKNVLEWLEAHPVKGRKALWMDSALRGLKSICFGYMGSVVNTSVQPNLSHLLEKRVILELDSLTNADKTLIIESMLLWIHHYRLSQPDREIFKHAMIIEEAHHILLRRTGAGQGGEAITDTILREIRELGESIVLVDQHPSLISIPAMGNTYTTLCMNVKHRSDVNAAASAMLLSDEEKEILGILPVGQAVVKLQGRFLQPFQISIPHIKIPKGSVDDASLAQFMLEKNILKPCQPANHVNSPDASPESLSEWEKQLLQSVLDNPLAGTVERYKNLGVSRRKGNTIRESCIHKKLISLVEIRTRSGKLVLVELTRLGRKILREMGFSISEKPRWGGLEHEYWKKKTAEKLEKNGWSVKLEEPVNGYTDIIAEKDGGKLAVEIETGKSDWRANLQKNLQKGFQQILIIATNPEAYRKISAETHEFTGLSALRVELAQNLA